MRRIALRYCDERSAFKRKQTLETSVKKETVLSSAFLTSPSQDEKVWNMPFSLLWIFFFGFLLRSSLLLAFIPPPYQMVREVLEGRKAGTSELWIRHRFELQQGEIFELEEQWVGDTQKGVGLWKLPAGAFIGGVVLEKKNYVWSGGERRTPLKSLLPLKYLLASSPEDLLGSMVGEHFLTREQLQQYKPGFNPSGDPQTWDVKSNYFKQDGLSLRRAKGVPSYFVTSAEEGAPQRGIYFDKELAGIRRIEWKEGKDTVAWNFDFFSKLQSSGTFPKRMSFEKNGVEVIVSELLVHRPAKEKQSVDLRQTIKAMSTPSGHYEEGLRLLLSYR